MSKFSMQASAAAACAAGLLLVACGGGGPATPGFDATNYQTVAEPVAASVVATAGVVDVLNGLLTQETPMAAGQAAVSDPVALLNRARAYGSSGREQAQAAAGYTEACPGGGSISVSSNFARADILSPGDYASVKSNGCMVNGDTVLGELSVTVRSYSETTSDKSGSLAVSFRKFGSVADSLDGGATLDFAAGRSRSDVSVRFNNTTVVTRGLSMVLNYTASLEMYGTTISVAGGVSANGHDYTLTQLEPFGGAVKPGTLQITDAVGARVHLVVGPDRFNYHYFAAGNNSTTPDAVRAGLPLQGTSSTTTTAPVRLEPVPDSPVF